MALKLAFLTGTRAEYGLAKAFLRALHADPRFELEIIPNGMHLLKKYGTTVNEIRADGFPISVMVETYSEEGGPKAVEFSRTVECMSRVIRGRRLDAVFLIGDRIEAYASALAAHFAGIPIIHSGGGHLTHGAVDNIYRYNISNLADLHFATSRNAYERLCSCPLVDNTSVHFVGSVAVDAIEAFKINPKPASDIKVGLEAGQYALMTFHPVTAVSEPIEEIMQAAIDTIISLGLAVLVTYPNNDVGSEAILGVIEANRARAGVFVVPSLGADRYYAAMHDCRFVVGNSSSGLSEAPYFHKPVLNVGVRQDGRDKDAGVLDVLATPDAVGEALVQGFEKNWEPVPCNQLYGTGNSVGKGLEIILEFLISLGKEGQFNDLGNH